VKHTSKFSGLLEFAASLLLYGKCRQDTDPSGTEYFAFLVLNAGSSLAATLFVVYEKQLYLEVLIIPNSITSIFSEEVYILQHHSVQYSFRPS